MSQADSATTTTRPHFASAGAVRRPPSPQPSGPLTARELAEDILKSHRHLIERLTALPPNTINPFLEADEDDLTARAETLRCHLLAVQQYVIAFVRDTASYTHALNTDRLRLDGLFRDTIGDLCGAIENAARVQEIGGAQ